LQLRSIDSGGYLLQEALMLLRVCVYDLEYYALVRESDTGGRR
jgi:hypothetical protein